MFSKKEINISPYSNVAIAMKEPYYKNLDLSANRDFLFESQIYTTLFIYTHIVDKNISFVFVQNNTNYLIILLKYVKLGHIMKYKKSGYYAIEIDQ